MPMLRDAVERRLEWQAAQPWSWDVAVALGRVQASYGMHQLARCEPLGRDRHGRCYQLLEGTVWVLAADDGPCVTLHGVEPVAKLVNSLSRGACASERLLHLSLSKLLADDAIAEKKEPAVKKEKVVKAARWFG